MGCIAYNISAMNEIKKNEIQKNEIEMKKVKIQKGSPNMKYSTHSKLSYKRVLREFFIDDVVDIILSYLKDFTKVCDCVLNQRYSVLAEEKLNSLVLRNSFSSSLNKEQNNIRTLYSVDICNKCISTIYNKKYNFKVFNPNKKNYLNIFVKNTECNIIINSQAFIHGMNDMVRFNVIKKEYKYSHTKLFYHMLEYYLPDAKLTYDLNNLTAFKRVNIIIRQSE